MNSSTIGFPEVLVLDRLLLRVPPTFRFPGEVRAVVEALHDVLGVASEPRWRGLVREPQFAPFSGSWFREPHHRHTPRQGQPRPHPPAPGLPRHAPSVYTIVVISNSFAHPDGFPADLPLGDPLEKHSAMSRSDADKTQCAFAVRRSAPAPNRQYRRCVYPASGRNACPSSGMVILLPT